MIPSPAYRMPAEWEPHEATWLGWPVNEEDWPGKLAAVEWVFVEIVRHLSACETVHVLVPGAEVGERSRALLEQAGAAMGAVRYHTLETNRNWLRDSGAIFAEETATGKGTALAFEFNAWAKYDNYMLDRGIPPLMAGIADLPLARPLIRKGKRERPLVLEGGAIDVNGSGLLLATEECLLGPEQERNPGFGREPHEAALREWLGAEKVLWLEDGIEGDDTGGHIDDVARFTGERTVVIMEERGDSPTARALKRNAERLRAYSDDRGRLEVVSIPMPEPLIFDGLRLPASYANFYIANGAVLVPTFNDPNDRIALGILQELFPDRVVRGIHAVDLVWGFGTLHCLTQQQPRFAAR